MPEIESTFINLVRDLTAECCVHCSRCGKATFKPFCRDFFHFYEKLRYFSAYGFMGHSSCPNSVGTGRSMQTGQMYQEPKGRVLQTRKQTKTGEEKQ